MSYHIKEEWLTDYDFSKHDEILETYFDDYYHFVKQQSIQQQRKECLSGYNRIRRAHLWSSEALKVNVRVGDICYLEYGLAFINEAGYQHFGLVLAIFNHKLLVAPMTSNKEMIQQARNVMRQGKQHLYYIGKWEGLNKPSVLFLNDIKFINSARIISINGHMDPDSKMFREIMMYLKTELFGPYMVK